MPSKTANHICPNSKCKEEIKKPLSLTDLSKTPAETYYACPRCMTKLSVATEIQQVPDIIASKAQKMPPEEEEQSISEVIEPQKTKEKPAKPPEPKEEETPPGCPHHFGYLGTRPKEGAIPEQCLTCRKMIECTFRT